MNGPPPDIKLDGLEILVVDDDGVCCKVIERMLCKFGAHVQTAISGKQALELFERRHHPIVVTDICMPGMDGMELVAGLKERDELVMVIAATAVYDTNRLISAIQLGFSDYILKPVEADKLLWAVKRCRDILTTRQLLTDEQNKFRTVLECLGEGVSIKSPDLQVQYQNRVLTEMLGDLTGMACYTAFDHNTEPCPDCPAQLAMHNGGIHTAQRSCLLKGRHICIESTASPLLNSRGKVIGAVEIIRDITEKNRTEQVLSNIAKGIASKTGAEFFTSLAVYLTEALGMSYALVGEMNENHDHIKSLAYCSKGTIQDTIEFDLAGKPCSQVIANGFSLFSHGVTDQFPEDNYLRSLGIQSYCGVPLTDSQGRAFGLLCTFDPQPITRPEMVSDIISIFASRASAELERVKNEKSIQELAFNDPLTGLANRRLFQNRLGLAIASAHRYGTKFGLFYLDLDHFKDVNDRFGHEAGDQVLIQAGERIRECCKRDTDTISRFGGDEFAIIVSDCGERDSLVSLAKRLIDTFSHPLRIGDTEVRITTSIGISIYPDNGTDAKTLQIASDRAMYAAKHSSRNTYRFSNP